LNLHDGTNILVDKDVYKTGAGVVLENNKHFNWLRHLYYLKEERATLMKPSYLKS